MKMKWQKKDNFSIASLDRIQRRRVTSRMTLSFSGEEHCVWDYWLARSRYQTLEGSLKKIPSFFGKNTKQGYCYKVSILVWGNTSVSVWILNILKNIGIASNWCWYGLLVNISKTPGMSLISVSVIGLNKTGNQYRLQYEYFFLLLLLNYTFSNKSYTNNIVYCKYQSLTVYTCLTS